MRWVPCFRSQDGQAARVRVVAQLRVGGYGADSERFLRLPDAGDRTAGRVQRSHLHEQPGLVPVDVPVGKLPVPEARDHAHGEANPAGLWVARHLRLRTARRRREAERLGDGGLERWMDTDRSARRVRHLTPGRRPTCAFEARRTYVPSTSNTASKPFESVANDVNKPCLGSRERRDPAADARRIIEIDVELSQPPVER